MSFITTSPREQLMLPTSIEEYVSSDNIVRFIDSFVDKVYATGYNLIRLRNVETVSILLEKLAQWNPISVFFAFLSFLYSKNRRYYPVFCLQTYTVTI